MRVGLGLRFRGWVSVLGAWKQASPSSGPIVGVLFLQSWSGSLPNHWETGLTTAPCAVAVFRRPWWFAPPNTRPELFSFSENSPPV